MLSAVLERCTVLLLLAVEPWLPAALASAKHVHIQAAKHRWCSGECIGMSPDDGFVARICCLLLENNCITCSPQATSSS